MVDDSATIHSTTECQMTFVLAEQHLGHGAF